MNPFHRLVVIVVIVGFCAAGISRAQEVVKLDPVPAAIQTIKDATDKKKSSDRAFKSQFEKAQKALVAAAPGSVPKVVALLDEMKPQTQMNAAIILSMIAAKSPKPSKELLDALETCVGNRSDGVRYWGVTGLVRSNAPKEMKNNALRETLDMDRPPSLRLAVLSMVGQAGYKDAAPVLKEHMEDILKPFKAKVKENLSVRSAVAGGRGNPVFVKKDISNLKPGEGKDLAERLARIPEIAEMLLTGSVHEDFMDKRPKNSFYKTPPWELEKCIEEVLAAP
jgi:hypothetical protein